MTAELTVHTLVFARSQSDGQTVDQGFDGDSLQHTQKRNGA